MKTLQADVAIIGAGTAGMTALRSALAHTDRVISIQDGPSAPPARAWAACPASC